MLDLRLKALELAVEAKEPDPVSAATRYLNLLTAQAHEPPLCTHNTLTGSKRDLPDDPHENTCLGLQP